MVDHVPYGGESIDERASRLLADMQRIATPEPAAKKHVGRGWFQFGIGEVFFIVLLVAFWLAGETAAVRERQRLRRWAESIGGKISSHPMAITFATSADGRSVCVPVEDLTSPPATTSFLQRVMRDEGVGAFVIYRELADDEAAHLRDAFPEAAVIWITPDQTAHSTAIFQNPQTLSGRLIGAALSVGFFYILWRLVLFK